VKTKSKPAKHKGKDADVKTKSKPAKPTKRTKRTTAREIRAYEYVCGFNHLMDIVEDAWRAHVFKLNNIQAVSSDPIANKLWEILKKARKEIQPKDREWRKLRFGDEDIFKDEPE
jgi:hypothetical protein